MSQLHLVISSCPNRESAESLAQQLVTAHLAACVSILPGVTSIYHWQGALQQDSEVLLLIKTAQPQVQPLITQLQQLHPYEVPEIIALAADAVHPPYLHWVLQCTDSR